MKFVPYHELNDTPNIVVDGGGVKSTRLVLSHWPHSGTPQALKADLSAEIVFNYLSHPEFQIDVPAVSNNHFDEDGLISLFTILNPEQGVRQKDLLIDIASAGDFGTYKDRRAVRTYFIISAFADSEKSPLNKNIFQTSYPETAAALYVDLLARLPDILQHPESYEGYWRDSDELLRRSELGLADGTIRIDEVPDIDLAVVKAAEDVQIHPIAVHNATKCFRVLIMQGRTYTFSYRYETWVQYISRRPIARVDLHPLASLLSQEEGSLWTFDGVDAIIPSLKKEDGSESRIPPEALLDKLVSFLKDAPPAWDPFD